MADKKVYLDQEGLERLVAYIQAELSNKISRGEQVVLPEDLVHTADLSSYASLASVTELVNSLEDYAKKSDIPEEQDLSDYVRSAALENYATAADLERVEAKATSAYHVKGSVADLEALQAIEEKEIGDVYNLEDTGINAVWTGEIWDELGTFVDLTPYLKEADIEAISRDELNRILFSGKTSVVSSVDGLSAMIANDEPAVEVILNSDLALDKALTVPAGKKVTINLDGNKLSSSSRTFIARGELVIEGDGEIESKSWGIAGVGSQAKVTINSGSISAKEAAVSIQQGAKFEMNGGTLEATDNAVLMGQGTAGNGGTEMVINGGKLVAHITTDGYVACGIYMPNDGKLVMNGGEIVSDGAGIVMRAGDVELNGGSIAANGEAGVVGKVGDSRVVVGPYAVVYDEKAQYPGLKSGEFKLTIGKDMKLQGTDDDIGVLMPDGKSADDANIIDNR